MMVRNTGSSLLGWIASKAGCTYQIQDDWSDMNNPVTTLTVYRGDAVIVSNTIPAGNWNYTTKQLEQWAVVALASEGLKILIEKHE